MKTLTLIAAVSFTLFSCNQGELDRSHQQKDSLSAGLAEREKLLNEREKSLDEFVESFNEVERNLDCVAVRQHVIYNAADNTKGELKGGQREKINEQIKAINNLMEENRKTISQLQRKVKNSNSKNKKLEETIATLNGQIQQKDAELAALNERLAALNAKVIQLELSVDSLRTQSASQAQTIAENVAALHTAYYIVGKAKDLRDAKVIDKKGGLLGIGRTAGLDDNFNKGKFTKIDYMETKTIAVNSDNVKVITNHPPDSYKLETDPKKKNVVTQLVISDPEKFWSVSKYLVVTGDPVKSAQ